MSVDGLVPKKMHHLVGFKLILESLVAKYGFFAFSFSALFHGFVNLIMDVKIFEINTEVCVLHNQGLLDEFNQVSILCGLRDTFITLLGIHNVD